MDIQKMTYNRKEAARYIGLSENTFDKLLTNGKIRHLRVGRRILIPKQALDQYLEEAV